MMEMALEAAFCSHQAWSVRISEMLVSTRATQRGSVGKRRPSIGDSLEGEEELLMGVF